MRDENFVAHISDVEAELRSLTNRDLQLWSMGALVMVVLALAVLCLVETSAYGRDLLHWQSSYVPQLAAGLVALVILLNLYVLGQRRILNRTTSLLLGELARNGRLTRLSFVDPVTELMKREFLPELLNAEITRRNATGSELTFLAIRADSSRPGADSPAFAGAISQMLRGNFRGFDYIVRYSQFEYVVVMPETTPAQAVSAIQRLETRVDQWNLASGSATEMLLFYSLQACTGTDAMDEIRQVLRKTYTEPTTLPADRAYERCATNAGDLSGVAH